jgi:hypothetical protein
MVTGKIWSRSRKFSEIYLRRGKDGPQINSSGSTQALKGVSQDMEKGYNDT